jgi:hypothetical protein
VKTEKAKKTKDRKADPATKSTGNKTTENTGSGKRTWWKTWRAKSYTKGGDPIDASKADENKSKPKARTATAQKAKGKGKQAVQAKDASPAANEDKTNQAKQQGTHTAQKLKGLADAKAHVMSTSGQKAPRAYDDFFDERELTAPPPKPRPRPLNVDDGGFISPVVTKPKVKATKADTRRSTIMPDRAVTTAAPQIDASSAETFRAATQSAARELRKSAGKLQEDAAELRRQAQTWIENGETSTAEGLRREAAGMEQDADQRLAAAAGYEDAAASAK